MIRSSSRPILPVAVVLSVALQPSISKARVEPIDESAKEMAQAADDSSSDLLEDTRVEVSETPVEAEVSTPADPALDDDATGIEEPSSDISSAESTRPTDEIDELQGLDSKSIAPVEEEAEPTIDQMISTEKETDQRQPLRLAGLGVMAGGGLLAVSGVALVIGFTARERGLEKELDDANTAAFRAECGLNPDQAVCLSLLSDQRDAQDKLDKSNTGARVGGIIAGVGFAAVATGGILLHIAKKRRAKEHVRIAPTWGGAVVSGRF